MKRILAWFVTALLAGCGAGGGQDVAAKESQNLARLGQAATFLDQTDATRTPEQRMGDTLAWLQTQPGVTSAALSPDALTLSASFDNGLEGALVLDVLDPEDAPLPGAALTRRPSLPFLKAPCPPGATCSDQPSKVALVKGRDLTEGLATRHFPTLTATVQGMDLQAVPVEQGDFNTGFMADGLQQFQIVYVYGHGGSDATTSWLSTGQRGPWGNIPPPSAADREDLAQNRIVAAGDVGWVRSVGQVVTFGMYKPPVPLYKIKPSFFAAHYPAGKKLAGNALIFYDGCSLRPDIAQALADAGASAVVFYGPDSRGGTSKTSPLSSKADQDFFSFLSQGKSVGEAIDQVKAAAHQNTIQVQPASGRDLRFVSLANVDFTSSPCPPTQGSEVTFTQINPTPANAIINKWVWDFGDGSPPQESPFVALANTNTVKHTYNANLTGDDSHPGFFKSVPVKLTVTDLFGHSITITKDIAIAMRGRNIVRLAATGATGETCPVPPTTPPTQLRIKVITTFSQDPNDFLADALFNVHVLVGSTDAVIGSNDDTARITVSPGSYIVKFPKDNGLDSSTGEHLYRVGSVNLHVTKDAGSGVRCAPNSQEGDVRATFDVSAANPDSQSEYEVALRIVPFDAPAVQNGASCL